MLICGGAIIKSSGGKEVALMDKICIGENY